MYFFFVFENSQLLMILLIIVVCLVILVILPPLCLAVKSQSLFADFLFYILVSCVLGSVLLSLASLVIFCSPGSSLPNHACIQALSLPHFFVTSSLVLCDLQFHVLLSTLS